MIRNIVPQSHLTIRDLRQTFRMQLDKSNYNDSTIARLLGHGDQRSVHRYNAAKTFCAKQLLPWKNKIVPKSCHSPKKKKHLLAQVLENKGWRRGGSNP
jgi:integrase